MSEGTLFFEFDLASRRSATSLFKEVAGKAMMAFCLGKEGVLRCLRPNLLILDKGALTSLSLSKAFSGYSVP